MRKFEKGDKVVCIKVIINKYKSYSNITKGSLYNVISTTRSPHDICIINDIGHSYIYPAKRFKLVTEYRDSVIDNILM